jgi:hypothetical protein
MKDYLHELNDKLHQGDATEHTFRPAMESLLKRLSKDSVVTNEPKRIKVGAPDFVIRRKIGKTQYLPVGYIETKDIGVDLVKLEKEDQISRYLKLDNLIVTDYVTFRWYVDGKLRKQAVLAQTVKGKLKLTDGGDAEVLELLEQFLSHAPLPIAKPEELAKRMAALCKQIDRIIVQAFEAREASDLLSGLKDAFERTLLPDLSDAQFADMFTQTLAYGLFAARIHHFQSPSVHGGAGGGEFRRSDAAKEIPKTNPFLRKLFDTINSTEIEDEPFIGFVDDLTSIMNHADIASILQFFGKRTGQEDPIVHFYETFLAAYDPKLRELRGVYYTPEPVVSYIVRSVDLLLKEKFGLKDGLADRSTIEVEVEENGQKIKKTMPRVLILDPACGTGTFLYHVIKLIRERFMQANNAGEWSDFVQKHLLPRIYGFELLMAPYAVAHLKLAMQLAGQDLDEPLRSQYAYDFSGSERLNVYMTNSLEMTEKTVQMAMFGLEKQIAEEANAARAVKSELPILVVMGNPPYSGHSANKNPWIEKLIRDYYFVDGEPLGEKNPSWLLDDYVKFIRFGQWRIDKTNHGILALITNNGYLDNPTFRGMRQNLMKSFHDICLLNLHGNSKKKERNVDGGRDQNVFDIQQGVSVGFFSRSNDQERQSRIRKWDLFGNRDHKYGWLVEHDIESTPWQTLNPKSNHYLFSSDVDASNNNDWSVQNIFLTGGWAVKTRKDYLLVDFERDTLVKRFEDIRKISTKDAIDKYGIREAPHWNFEQAKSLISPNVAANVRQILFRPFDTRFVFYEKCMIERGDHHYDLMHHLFESNLSLISIRRAEEAQEIGHFFVSNNISVLHSISPKEANFVFPLYLYIDHGTEQNHEARTSNLSPAFIADFSRKLGLKFEEGAPGFRRGKDTPLGSEKGTFGPEDVFNYIYAIFHSPTYRTRYAEFLKIDFPRVPLTSNVAMFRKLAALGGELVKLHLVEFDLPEMHPPLPPRPLGRDLVRRTDERRGEQDAPIPSPHKVEGDQTAPSVNGGGAGVSYPVKGDHIVEKVQYVDTKRQVWINKTQYFEGVPPQVWEFHIGGYQVAEKWLKDRKGRALNADDREHYRKIIYALSETMRLMGEIDAAIPSWPIA